MDCGDSVWLGAGAGGEFVGGEGLDERVGGKMCEVREGA